MFSKRLRLALAFFVCFTVAACGDATGPDPFAPDPLAFDFALERTREPKLVECPVSTSESISGTIGPLGGFLALDGNRITLPLFAVQFDTDFRLEVPASRFVELDITANGADSFLFQETVIVTIDYSHCSRSDIAHSPLTAWQIDPVTKELIEEMGGIDDKLTRTVTFTTNHLSTYSLAR